MNDLELGDRLRALVPDLELPLDPMSVLLPRIKRRRAVRLGAVATALAVITFAAIGLIAYYPGGPSSTDSVSTADGATGPIHDGHRYDGPPVPGYAGIPMWVVAHGRLGGAGSRWVELSYRINGSSCTWLAYVPTSRTATTTTTIDGDCASAPGAQPSGPGTSGGLSALGGVNRTLVNGTVPADVTTIRAKVSTGSLLHRETRTGLSPVDTSHRYYVLDAGASGFIGTLTYYNAAGHPVGHVAVNAEPLPSLSPAQHKAAEACGTRGYLLNIHSQIGRWYPTADPWEESPVALAGFSTAGAILSAALIFFLWRRRRWRHTWL
jgi:hypothetical protein